MSLPAEREDQLSIGGFQGIKKIKGLLLGVNVEDPPATWQRTDEKQVVKVDLADAVVLAVFGDEDPPELKEGKFSFFIPYVEAGKSPNKSSIYWKCWVETAEKATGKKPSASIGQIITLEKLPLKLFDTYLSKDKIKGKNLELLLDNEGKEVIGKNDTRKVRIYAKSQETGLPNHFCFVPNETLDSEGIKDYIKALVVGKNQKAALHDLLLDNRAKAFPDFKAKLKDGTLAEFLGLKLDGEGDRAVFVSES